MIKILLCNARSRIVLFFCITFTFSGFPLIVQAETALEHNSGVFSGTKNAKHPAWFKESFLDFSDDIDEASAEGKRLVLYFWQAGCPYCNQLWEHNMAVDGIEQSFESQFDVVAINMWGDQEVVTVQGKSFTEKQLARALDVDFTPTLQFYDENKKQVLRLNGYIPPERFKLALSYASGEHDADQSFNQYVLSKAGAGQGSLIDEPFYLSVQDGLKDRSQTAAERPLAVLFETPACEACERFHATALKHADTRGLLEKMDVVRLNARSEQAIVKPDGSSSSAKQWAEELGLTYYPSIVFFNGAGEQVMLMDAYFRNFHTQSIFAYVLEEAYKTEPSFQRYLSARADRFIEQGIDIDIWEE